MTKKNKIIYWFFTCWLALGMVSTGIVQLIRMPEEVANFTALGFPIYLMTLIGIWKLLGTAAILAPRLPLLKEWAYAGFFFTMSGAIVSRAMVGGSVKEMAPAILMLILIAVSWYFRPADRKPVAGNA
jgi:hypothetical protein